MKYLTAGLMILILLVAGVVWPSTSPASASGTIPTFSIVSVVRDKTVTIKTYNFPANDMFKVLMGAMGTRGVNGIKVATTDSGKGGTFQKTYTIPASLQGSYQIAIRLQSTTGSGYFAYNWFYNNTTGTGTTPTKTPSGYSGFPTFSIVSVARDETVTIKTKNLPPDDSFVVTMGAMGTRGINGIKVKTTDSGKGGTKTLTYDIPDSLKGSYQIAIRMQSQSSGYFAYNWFYNNTTSGAATPTPGPSPTPKPSYSGIPTFSIVSVVRDQTVTIKTNNLPANDSFVVTMGAMGTRGINGIKVKTTDSGKGGTKTLTYDIPDSLKGSYQIAIRMQSSSSGYFAYNWFYNNTANDP